jgi:hypothetical protein
VAEAKEYWKKYESGVSYNSSFKDGKDWYQAVKVWNRFYNGDQWVGVDGADKLPKPVFNYIKRIGDFQIASLTSSDIAVNIEPLEFVPHTQANIDELFDSDFVNAEIKNLLEKLNFRVLKKDALRKACITGDMCAHIIFNPTRKPYRGFAPEVKGEIEVELVDATNVIFGNANEHGVDKQPWIVLTGRDTVANLKREAEMMKAKGQVEDIRKDDDTEFLLTDYAKTEISGDEDGKAKYIYFYEKEIKGDEEKIYVTKCTKEAIIYEKVETGYTRYPVAFGNWYKQDNTYHGRGLVEGMCPAQISLNKLAAMCIYYQMMTAFSPVVYDGDMIDEWTNEIGTAYEVKNLNGRSLNDVAMYMTPANMSSSIVSVMELTLQYMKDSMGVSDASLGNIDPKNTSAILAVQKSTAVPLENVKDNLYDFVEQIVLILLDVMATKYGIRPVVISGGNGARELINYDFSKLKDMDLKLGIDVGETTYFSELAMLQTMDNLLQGQYIEFIDYLERIPDEMFPKKAEYVSKLKEKQETDKEVVYEQMSQYMAYLPPNMQQGFAQAVDQLSM